MAIAAAEVYALTERGEAQSSALPPLLVKAEKVAATVILGVHGRRTAGPGESFWQYRPYSFGDSTQRVDWHRSAKADGVFIRENEWECANTLWVWANTGPRMDYKSHLASTTKMERAQILALAMASLAVRGHERIGALGSGRAPSYGRAALIRVANFVARSGIESLPKNHARQRRAAALLVSDFLEPIDELRKRLTVFAEAGLAGHLVQIADPAEESLPFEGRIEFLGLDLPQAYLARKTENLRDAYIKAYSDHREKLRTLARSIGFSFVVHRTDEPATKVLLPLHQLVSGTLARQAGRA